ncbi:SET and MYND domain-containing protein 4-like [Sitodiplosis mosellana]|uniref:SET and MYND domain-containing protein 4-like n=1 Tax=Sitodiplosis mosellana TaxID=263140 RepID=UPI0024438AE4|nr:SET and MYND domain-containing protein 4-like [Sitodiplosis mosellana]
MLWKKETNRNDPIYVDIFALNGGLASLGIVPHHARCEDTDTTFNKNDAVSLQKRNEGNEHFKQGKLLHAIEFYGESLCYAENGSKNISLAYANRSTCFLKLKRYEECLTDIEMAKQAGYPADLMPKLERRKEECLKGIGEGEKSMQFESKLSFEPDKYFPCLANVLEIDVDDDGDLAIFAKEDIDVGQIVAVEKMFMGYIYSWHGLACNICLKTNANLMPCMKCNVAMFCSEECQAHQLHKFECGLKACKCDLTNNNIMRVVRSFLLIVDSFESADELMTFVEQAISSDRNQMPSNLSDAKSQYEAFLKLPIGSQSSLPKDVLCIIFEAHKLLFSIPKIHSMFTAEKHRRFLMHLMSHHYQILDLNSIVHSLKLCSDDQDEETSNGNGHDSVKWASSQIGMVSRYVKNSCAPNVHETTSNGNTVIVTVRPIKKGQQLSNALLLQLLTQSKKERKQVLWRERKMKCKCVRCKGLIASTVQREIILADPDFQFISSDWSDDSSEGFDVAIQARFEKCKSLLRRYGQFPWCEEFGEIVELFIRLICIQQQQKS